MEVFGLLKGSVAVCHERRRVVVVVAVAAGLGGTTEPKSGSYSAPITLASVTLLKGCGSVGGRVEGERVLVNILWMSCML